jgi:hypothetical protein
MDLRTSYQQDYIPHQSISAQDATTEQQTRFNAEHVYTRRPMNEISQTSFDYRPYPQHRPITSTDMDTFQSQIKLGNSSSPTVKCVSSY